MADNHTPIRLTTRYVVNGRQRNRQFTPMTSQGIGTASIHNNPSGQILPPPYRDQTRSKEVANDISQPCTPGRTMIDLTGDDFQNDWTLLPLPKDRNVIDLTTESHQDDETLPIQLVYQRRAQELLSATGQPPFSNRDVIDLTFEDNTCGNGNLIAATGALSLERPSGQYTPESTQDCSRDRTLELLDLIPFSPLERYFSLCSLGRTERLESLCHEHYYDQLIGSADREGNTGAILSAAERGGLDTLRWLHARGDPISQANHRGRTPLMVAALWGNLSTIEYLAEQSVNLAARDNDGLQAADLADDTESNARERNRLSGGVCRDTPDASEQRKLIAAFLRQSIDGSPMKGSAPSVAQELPTAPTVSQNSDTGRLSQLIVLDESERRSAFFYRLPNGSLEIWRPQQLLDPPTGQLHKAFGTLDLGPTYPCVNAMSGFSHGGWPNVLDNNFWTDRAQSLRTVLGLWEDKEAASHVEPQLLAYLYDRHPPHVSERGGHNLCPVITISKPDLCAKCIVFFERFKSRFPSYHVAFHCVGDSSTAPLQIRR